MSDAARTGPLPHSQVFLYSLIGVPIGMTLNAFLFLMPAYYATRTSLSLAAIASALMIARSIEFVTDPMIGYLSDRTRSRFGSRKPWILIALPLAPIAAYQIYHPDSNVDWLYFLTWSGLTYFSWGLVNIPALAWGTELGRTYHDRSRLFSSYGLAVALGALLFAAIPILPAFASAEISPQTVGVIGWTIAATYPLLIIPALLFARQGQPNTQAVVSIVATLRSLRANRPLWRLVVCYSLGGLASGLIVSCWFFYASIYLGAGALFPYTILAFYVGNAIALPIWLKIMLAMGKHRAWAVGWATSALIALCLPWIPGGGGNAPLVVALFLAYGATAAVELAAPAAILADVVDYDVWKSGSNKSGNYNAFLIVTQKASIALGSSAGYFLLDYYDYQVKGGHNGPHATFGFLLTLVYVPTALYCLASLFMWNFPIDRRRHELILKRLGARQLREP